MLLRCPSCEQSFISVFTEQIDWQDGNDPQYWTTIPLTETEASLVSSATPLTEEEINAIDHSRRSLHHDFPKDGKKRVAWGRGIRVGTHD